MRRRVFIGTVGGLAASLAFPAIRVLELVKIVTPGVSRSGVMLNPALPASNSWMDILPSSGKALGLQSRVVKATSREGVGPAFIEVLKAKVQALIVAPMAP